MSRFATIFLLAIVSTSAVFGQAVAIGSVSGTVMDQSAASVPGASVRMTETDKGTVYESTSNAEGHYTFNNLPVGPYRLEVQAKGFKEFRQTDIVLQVAENLTQNVQLEVGASTETVEVRGGASMVETRDSSISQVTTQERIVDLPLNGRNPADLLQLSGIATSSMTLN